MKSRKQILESKGFTCKNWQWSWSFVNHDKMMVCFSALDINYRKKEKDYLVLDKKWTELGTNTPGYPQALEHIDLIINHGYKVSVLKQVVKKPAIVPVKIVEVYPTLKFGSLVHEGEEWYVKMNHL